MDYFRRNIFVSKWWKKWPYGFQGKLLFFSVGYFGCKAFTLISQIADQYARILVIEEKVNNIYVLVNVYDNNLESEQLPTVSQLSDLWKHLKHFTFRQDDFSGYIQGRLDFFSILSTLQEVTKGTDIVTAFSAHHSPIFF